MIRVLYTIDRARHEPVLRVEATLGTAFESLPRPVQRRIVEAALTKALVSAHDALDQTELAEMVPA